MDGPSFKFKARLWLYDGQAAWHFLTLPKAIARIIKAHFSGPRPGFGSIRVEARIGKTAWKTSIFPDSKSGSYVLPVKRDVRAKENLKAGRGVSVELTLAI